MGKDRDVYATRAMRGRIKRIKPARATDLTLRATPPP